MCKCLLTVHLNAFGGHALTGPAGELCSSDPRSPSRNEGPNSKPLWGGREQKTEKRGEGKQRGEGKREGGERKEDLHYCQAILAMPAEVRYTLPVLTVHGPCSPLPGKPKVK